MAKQGLASGRYNKGSKIITLASGHNVEAKELIAMKKKKMTNTEIIAYLENQEKYVPVATVRKEAVVVAPAVKEVHVCTWASVPQEQIVNALNKNEAKSAWYKKLFRKEEGK